MAQDTRESEKPPKIEGFRKKEPECPKVYAGVISKAKNSRKAAICAKCLDCCCYQREEIRLCPIPDCPLYVWRPYK